MHLEHLRWQHALSWIFHSHAIEYHKVQDATKLFSILVFVGLFAFQVWVAERVLVTIFMRNSGADEVIIPEHEGGLVTERMIARYYPASKA